MRFVGKVLVGCDGQKRFLGEGQEKLIRKGQGGFLISKEISSNLSDG